ncbi:MAG: lasso peptide isopeptide bond-forming cyclase [Sterolibacteriaceae bacterium]|nr:lasso peptide isopeptide bond-forming cyclase [Sterolibacteriaceae bacterium]MBK9085355.1 lasso peptide isopeptide bond-forming cyclase [Sterolibacteriaceae bacterium]
MSAIAGLLRLDGLPAEASQIERMTDVLSHRGPDGRAILLDGPASFGHCMLRSTPESLKERQPWKFGELAITADARIDNREELFDRLKISDTPLDQISDCELLVRAYLHWGEDCPQRLVGDFAFAIWDSRKRQFFCARDQMGVKPFYYAFHAKRQFILASEIKAILCIPDVPRTINEVKIGDYLLADFGDKSRTFYSHVSRLPPATTLVVGDNGIRLREYWSLDPTRETRLSSDSEYAEAFREVFSEAVRCRLRSAFPVGSMLSGGLDSSSIACVAHDLMATERAGDLHTFSIIFDEVKGSDERGHIHDVLGSRGFQSHFTLADGLTPFDDIDKVLWHQDEPFYAPNLFLNRQVWKITKESGVRVLLDGLFGDNVVSHGVEHLNELANRWRWLALARELKQVIETSKRDVPLREPLLRYILQMGVRPYVPEAALALWRRLRGLPATPDFEQTGILQTDFCKRTGIRERLSRRYIEERKPKSASQAHAASLESGMIETALEIYNRGCGEFGIETRFPFADKRVVEYCLGIPGAQKISQGFTRMILRRGLAGHLPESIRWRTGKGDLQWSFLRGFTAQREFLDATIKSSSGFLGQILDLDSVDQLLVSYRKGKITEAEIDLFYISVLSAWHESTFGVSG